MRRIRKEITPDLLKENLKWIYEKKVKLYEGNYNKDVFKHLERYDPENLLKIIDEKEKELYKEKLGFIIESGFKLLIILKINRNTS